MSTPTRAERVLIEKIRELSPGRIAAAEDFVDFLLSREDGDEQLRYAAMKLSEPSFAEVWDNPDDAAYDNYDHLGSTAMTKQKDVDCVETKRRAQQEILKELEGHPPEEQYKIIRRLADESPFCQRLRKAKRSPDD